MKKNLLRKCLHLFGFVFLVVFGQNCSPVGFEDAGISDMDSNGIPDDAKMIPIAVTGQTSNTYERLKLVVILDTSLSMDEEIQKVKTALDGFLGNIRSRQAVEVSVYGINHATTNAPVAVYDVQGREIPLTSPESEVFSKKVRKKLSLPAATLSFTPSTSASDYEQKRSRFQTDLERYIQAQRSSHGDRDFREAGLCTMARYLHDPSLSQNGDKVSFIMISDEDDSSKLYISPTALYSSADECPEFHILKKDSYLKILFTSRAIRISYQATGTRVVDGGQTVKVSSGPISTSLSCTSSPSSPQSNGLLETCRTMGIHQTCSENLKSYIKSAPGMFGNMHTIESIDSCSAEVSEGDGSSYLYQKSVVQSLESVCAGGPLTIQKGDGTYQTAYESLTDYGSKLYGTSAWNIRCAGIAFSYNGNSSPIGFAAITDAASAPDKIREYAIRKYGEAGVTANVIVYDSSDAGCTVHTGALGSRYVQLIGSQKGWKRFSICDESYAAALANTENLVDFKMDRDYELNLPAGHVVVAAQAVKTDGTATLLPREGYRHVDGTLSVFVNLPVGSQLRIYHDRVE